MTNTQRASIEAIRDRHKHLGDNITYYLALQVLQEEDRIEEVQNEQPEPNAAAQFE